MILIDNTVLSNFAISGELILLKIYCMGKETIADHFFAEFERGAKDGIFIDTNLEWIKRLNL